MLPSDAVRSPIDGIPGRAPAGDDSRSPTLPGGRELPGESSGKRVRPDATVRGIGPGSGSITMDAMDTIERAQTMDVRNSEVDIVPDGELQMSWMRSDWRFLSGVLGGALVLVVSMLFAIARDDGAAEVVPGQELGVVEKVAAAPVATGAPAEPVATVVPAPEVVAAEKVAEPKPQLKEPRAPTKKALAKASATFGKAPAARAKVRTKASATRGKKKVKARASVTALR